MAEKERYYIGINGQSVEVSRELYEVYYKGQRKEKYFTEDLKRGHTKINHNTGETIVVPSREDSYERLIEAEKQFIDGIESVEDIVIRMIMLEKLKKVLTKLNDEEMKIIHALFYQEPESVKFNASQPIKSQYFLMFKVFLQVLPLSPIG